MNPMNTSKLEKAQRSTSCHLTHSSCPAEELIGPQTPQLPRSGHLCILFFDEALASLPLDGTDLDDRFDKPVSTPSLD
jgi:hypothetical protein